MEGANEWSLQAIHSPSVTRRHRLVAMRIVGPPTPASDPPWAGTPAARRGAAGERALRTTLAAALDDTYILAHNLILPGGEGDIDAILIGPRVLVIEVKTYAEERPLRVRGLRWEYRAMDGRGESDGRWLPLDGQPSAQAQSNARRVAYALRSAALPAYGITPVVALVGGASCLVERPRVPVLRPAELTRFARAGARIAQPAWPELVLQALLVAARAVS